MLTVGVDLAAEPAGTALAVIEWSPGRARLSEVVVGADDAVLLDRIGRADKAGIDCPLGWPAAFVEFVSAHRDGHVTVPAGVAGLVWRRRLAYRVTDGIVRTATGRWPLSVAADRIGHTAMRAAALLAALAGAGRPVDRAGTGVVVEVYPAASLRVWGLPDRGYKRTANLARLDDLVDRLTERARWLDLGPHEALCRRSDHAIDAVLAAITARCAAIGATAEPDPDQVDLARVEGWIAVPTTPLSGLCDPGPGPGQARVMVES
jgi:predicted nuclease with RNAse H fold